MYLLPPAWEAAITGWLAWLTAAGLLATTIHVRRANVRMIARVSGAKTPAVLTTGMIVAIGSRSRWSRDHRRHVRTSLISFYTWAMGQGIVEHNPAADLPKCPESKPRPRPVPDPVWRSLLEAAAPREQMMARLAAEAGMRRAEVARCHRDDLVLDISGYALIVHGKGEKQRIVPITDRLAADIENHCARGYLFPGVTADEHLSAMHVGKLVGALLPPGWSMHKLRHRYASKGLAGTGDLLAVRDALGHASVATTQRYTATSDARVRRVAEAASGGASW